MGPNNNYSNTNKPIYPGLNSGGEGRGVVQSGQNKTTKISRMALLQEPVITGGGGMGGYETVKK